MIYSLAKNTSALLLPFHLVSRETFSAIRDKGRRVLSDREYKPHGLQTGKILSLENLSRFSSLNRVTNRSIYLWNFMDLKAWMLEKQRQEHGEILHLGLYPNLIALKIHLFLTYLPWPSFKNVIAALKNLAINLIMTGRSVN